MDFDFDEEFAADNPGEEVVEDSDDGQSPNKRSRSLTPVSKRKARGELTADEKKSPGQRKKVFQSKWLELAEYKGWLRSVPGDKYSAYCSACDIRFLCGKSELGKHASGQKHAKAISAVKSTKSIASMLVNTEKQNHEKDVKTAEIQLAALFADNNVSFRTADNLIAIQKIAFKDSKIAKDMTLGRDKCNAIVRNVIAKTETEKLAADLRAGLFSVLIDESTDKANTKAMDVMVKYIHPQTKKSTVQLLELVELDSTDCSAEKLWKAFEDLLAKHEIPVRNTVGLAVDSANVMVGANNSFWSRLKAVCPWAILIPCVCHAAAKVSSIACSKLPPNVEGHLRMLSTYLHGSPKRSAELREFQESYSEELEKMIKPSATRWLVMHACVEKYLQLHKKRALLGFFELRCFEDRDKKDKDAHKILAEIKNPFTTAHIQFLSYALNVLNEFNGLFQSKSVLIHKVYELSHGLMKTLCMNFMRDVYLDRLATINVTHPDYLLPDDEIELGPGCLATLASITPTPDTPETRVILERDKKFFRQRCLHFYTTAAKEVQSRLPLRNELIKQMQFLDPKVIFGPRTGPTALRDVNLLISHFKERVEFDENALALEWRRVPVQLPDSEKDRLSALSVEDLWVEMKSLKNGNGEPMFPNLCKLADIAMIVPHANADSERVFAIVTDVKDKKRNRMGGECLSSICVIRTAFRAQDIDCTTFKVGPEHLKSTMHKCTAGGINVSEEFMKTDVLDLSS